MKLRISTRLVILAGNYALKIPLSRRGWLQGINEAKVWQSNKGNCLLAPVLWSFCGVVCMQRVSSVSCVPLHLITLLKSMIPALDIDNCDLHRTENWGVLNGHVVLLDYGVDARVASMYVTP